MYTVRTGGALAVDMRMKSFSLLVALRRQMSKVNGSRQPCLVLRRTLRMFSAATRACHIVSYTRPTHDGVVPIRICTVILFACVAPVAGSHATRRTHECSSSLLWRQRKQDDREERVPRSGTIPTLGHRRRAKGRRHLQTRLRTEGH